MAFIIKHKQNVNGKKYNAFRVISVIAVEKRYISYIDTSHEKKYNIINKTNRQDARYV